MSLSSFLFLVLALQLIDRYNDLRDDDTVLLLWKFLSYFSLLNWLKLVKLLVSFKLMHRVYHVWFLLQFANVGSFS
jgi:hypothetical protein